MRRILVALSILAAAVAAASGQAADKGPAEVIAKIGAAWERPPSEGLALFDEILSKDKFVLLLHPRQDESKSTAVNRELFLRIFAKAQAENPSVKHLHKTLKLEVFGGVAYELAQLDDQKRDGQRTRTRVLNVYAREQDGAWRLVASAGADEAGALFE
jgi:ketosteroid isomerase-like protein